MRCLLGVGLFGLALTLAGCAVEVEVEQHASSLTAASPVRLEQCTGRTFEAEPTDAWQIEENRFQASLLGSAQHGAQDVLVSPGQRIAIPARFLHGDVRVAMDHEKVNAYINRCNGWQPLSTLVTDDEGRVELQVAPIDSPGIYEVLFELEPNGTTARSKIWVLPRGIGPHTEPRDSRAYTGRGRHKPRSSTVCRRCYNHFFFNSSAIDSRFQSSRWIPKALIQHP